MTEVVNVDFKARKKVNSKSLPGHKPFVAAEQPEFKNFVEGLAQAVEYMELRGGDWKRIVAFIHDPNINPPGENDELGTIIRISDPGVFSDSDQVTAAAIFVNQFSHLLDESFLPDGVEISDADPS